MIIRSVYVSQFRQFRESLRIDGLQNGLNVIAGDNEEGKSTILMAIRAALFERYKSSVGEDYRPYGQKVSPKVGLEFELQGKRYTLEKTFSKLKDGACVLDCDDGSRWEGPHAEEHLQELLEFSYPLRGPSKKELQGLPGLLWVEQGHAYEAVHLGEAPKKQLHSVFGAEMTELLGGDGGEAILRKIESLRSEFYDKRNNPRGDYKKAAAEIERLAEEVKGLENELADYDKKIGLLEQRRVTLREFSEESTIENARQKMEAAAQAEKEVTALQRRVDSATSHLKQLEADGRVANIEWETRQKYIQDLEKAAQNQKKTADELKAATASLDRLEKELKAKQRQAQELTRRKEIAKKNLERVALLEKLRATETEAKAIGANFKKARLAEKELKQNLAKKARITITAADLDKLRQNDRAHAAKREALRSAATRVEYRISPETEARIAGQRLEQEGEIEIAEPSALDIDGVGRFDIYPGGSELGDLRIEQAELEKEQNTLLERLGLASLDEAEQAMVRREAIDRQLYQNKATIEALAPDGLATLEAQFTGLVGEVRKLREEVAGADESANSDDSDESGDSGLDASNLRDQLGGIEAELAGVLDELNAIKSQCSTQYEQVVELRARGAELTRRVTAIDKELSEARSARSDEELAGAIAESASLTDKAGTELAALERRLKAASPDVAAAEAQRTRKVFEQVQANYRELERSSRELEIELNTLGQRGLAEELATARGKQVAIGREYAHMDAQAKALDLLFNTMNAALQRAKQNVAQPIVDKVRPYLQQLMPGAEPAVDVDLVLTGVNRDGDAEPFTNLSIGTREQLAIIIRLAYADLLSENGIPVTVILDDALVNSDDDRRDRMKAILFQAAMKYQILILTCHSREYRDAGGKFVSLAESRAMALDE